LAWLAADLALQAGEGRGDFSTLDLAAQTFRPATQEVQGRSFRRIVARLWLCCALEELTMSGDSIHLNWPLAAGPFLKDAALVEGEALARSWQQCVPDLGKLVRALGICGSQADDVLQDVYLVAREKRPAGLAGDDLRKWLMRVTANRCRLEHRQQQRWRRAFERLWNWGQNSTLPTSIAAVQQHELGTNVETALEQLRPIEREVIVLRYFAELNSAEIGELLSLNEATVRSHLARARRQLAQELAAWNPDERS
jgi:RNA polymerase sigma-70 factor, ECF subfamily